MAFPADRSPVVSPRGGCPWAVLLALCFCGGSGSVVRAQTANDTVVPLRQSSFQVPFEIVDPAADRRLREVQLYVSEDRGLTWQKAVSTTPDKRGFPFRVERDGQYWFAIRTIDIDGRASPASMDRVLPGLKVQVDTHAPIITLRQRAAREGMLALDWDIRDDNLDLTSFVLEYRVPGTGDWVPLAAQPGITGQFAWNAGNNGAVEVRLRVRDLAKNAAEKSLTVSAGNLDYAGKNAPPVSPPVTGRTQAGTHWVNKKQIKINYKIQEVGPSDVSAVQLWMTRDGTTWNKVGETKEHTPPFNYTAPEEGAYGFTLVFVSGAGLSTPPPHAGDAPQVWVEVDLTPPIVHWVTADVGRGPDQGKVTIKWDAGDKNLGRDCISIKYAADAPTKEWKSIADKIDNTGTYVWQLPPPPGMPYKFWVRVEAIDKAGNTGNLDTANVVNTDLTEPKGVILGVEPDGK